MKNVWLCIILFLGLAIAANAAIMGPYQPDIYTLQLWHLDEVALPAANSIPGGPDMNYLGTPATLGTASFIGFGNALNNNGGWLAPLAANDGTADDVAMNYAGSDTAFTYEAVIRIDFDPTAVQSTASMEILSGEGDSSERLFQFRILTYTTTHTSNELEFQNLTGTITAISAEIPSTGDDAIAQNGWYHVAVTCDAAGIVKLYWTKMDASRTQANLIGDDTMTVLTSGISPDLCIGNEGRDFNGRTEGFLGLIDEVRMSNAARPAAGMMFGAVAGSKATNPTPACFAIDVPTTQTLQWTKGTLGDTAQYLYISRVAAGSDPNFVGVSPVNVTGQSQYTPTLAIDETCYWAISNVIDEPNETTDSIVWKFDTEATPIDAHWALDGNANDSNAGNLHGTLVGEPVFDSGLIGQALQFDGTNDYIQLPAGFANFTSGLTYTVWAKPAAATNFARLLDMGNAGPGDNIILMRNGTSTDLTLEIYKGTTSSGYITATDVLTLDEWQMFAATVDRFGKVAIYKNGVLVQTGTTGMPNNITRTLNYIGESNWPDDDFYQGLMDDIHLYNYAKTHIDIVDMYNAVVDPDVYVCVTPPAYDINGDCKVNVDDVVSMALSWLDCGWYPDSYCP